ncbi:MAG: alanine racemase [Patescibacteria group bacterium]|jgi:alanine racemase
MIYNHSWIELSRHNLVYNITTTRKLLSPKTKLFAVVKSNAYGHGLKEIMSLSSHVVDAFCFAGTEEALYARSLTNKQIIALSYFATLNKQHITNLIKNRVELPLYSLSTLKALQNLKKPVKVHVKLDTGTSRIGFQKNEIQYLANALKSNPLIKVVGIYSHFAQAEKSKDLFTSQQLDEFKKISKDLISALKLKDPDRHIACSAALTKRPETHLNAVRLGIHLYGLSGLSGGFKSLKPVLEWKTHLIQVKKVPKGTTIGYNRSYRTQKATQIGIVPVGYADGFPRSLSNKGYVLISGEKAPIRGIVCMNMLMVDLSNVSDAKEFDEVTLIGYSRRAYIGADTLAKQSNTINYEITTRINPYLHRKIV